MAKKIVGFLQTRKQYSQLIYLILSLAVLLMAIIACLNNSLGWFASNKTVTGGNISVMVQDDSEFNVDGFTVYKYKHSADTFTYSFYSGDDATLNAYDSIFKSRNDKNAVIVKIDVSGLDAGSEFRLSFRCTDDTVDLNYISDIIYFRAAVLNLTGSDEEIYNSALTALKGDGITDTLFITADGDTITAKQTEVLSESLSMIDGGSIYVLMDYYPNVIQSKDIAFSGGAADGSTKTYPGDITSIEIIKE